MGKLAAALAALRHGTALADPAIWKRRQNAVNALVGLLGALLILLPLVGVHLELSHEDIGAIAGGVAAVLGMFNGYVTTASTDKLGLPARPAPADRPASDAGGDGPDEPRIDP